MLFKGFKFGMIIQIAVGPVCLFILTTASNSDFMNAFLAVLAVVIVDAVYILLAILGAVSFIRNPKYQFPFKIASSTIVLLFGLNIIINSFGINLFPGLNFLDFQHAENSFIYALLLTASNPLTILFWSGVFSAKVIEDDLKNKDLYYFGLGCICSTLIFLTFICFLGVMFHYYLPKKIITGLNVVVGFLLIFFSIKVLLKKTAVLEK